MPKSVILSDLLTDGIIVQVLKIANLVNEYRKYFLAKWSKLWNFPQMSPNYGVTDRFVFKSAKSLNTFLWVIEYWCKAQTVKFAWRIYSEKTKENLKLSQNSFLMLELRKVYFEVSQKPKSNLQDKRILVQVSKMQNLPLKFKT